MKKKIKELTLKEIMKVCKHCCIDCPLYVGLVCSINKLFVEKGNKEVEVE